MVGCHPTGAQLDSVNSEVCASEGLIRETEGVVASSGFQWF